VDECKPLPRTHGGGGEPLIVRLPTPRPDAQIMLAASSSYHRTSFKTGQNYFVAQDVVSY